MERERAATAKRGVTVDTWTTAALAALRNGGPAAIRVEAIARTLGVSKGSFYWHFADRKALVEAAIAEWEAQSTAAIIREAEGGATADDKLRRLLDTVSPTFDRAQPPGELLLYLQADAEGVRASVERVVSRRLDYVTDLLVDLGVERREARRRATLALTVTVGMHQLHIGAPATMSRPGLSRRAFTETLYVALTGRPR
ncbi:TetR/AcrR family transcriptional regulator [Mycobacterium deserti]|uniref:TetR/AcrR family transcriptional regulator n=1 Tax=Mycobacterium deserti TaxID=2978347 RepID=A0ABT2MAU3_9MYCO|nr:TetR/AcrR family transcriptional regulator [Mycobacterium deserti]MCT7659393.1 TetR/AcrR family transcriptional regulator [Mycobacterium deserti]